MALGYAQLTIEGYAVLGIEPYAALLIDGSGGTHVHGRVERRDVYVAGDADRSVYVAGAERQQVQK